MDGWIKIHRQLLAWEWFDKPEMVQLFIYLLLKANATDKIWHGATIGRGQLLTSLNTLEHDLNVSKRTIRTCLNRLKSTHEVTLEATNKFTIVTICNYDKYQLSPEQDDTQNDTQSDTQATHKRHTNDTQATLTKEYKNIRKKEIISTMANAIASSDDDTGLAGDEKINFDGLLKFINQAFDKANSSIPRIKTIAGQRKTIVVARIKEYGKEAFATVIEKAARSSFLNGGGSKGFRADFSWIIRPNNFLKILEGNYDDNSISTSSIINNGTTTTTGQHTDAASVRREQFARHIITKITSPDAPEPDISGNY